MTSKEIIIYIEKEGIDKLYKKTEKYFGIVDTISDSLIEGDLLGEYELAYNHDRLQGIYVKFYTTAQVLESYRDSERANTKIKEHGKLEKYRTQDSTILNAKADVSVKEIDNYYRDFQSYAQACSQLAIGCQARLKRLTVDKGNKGIDYTGEVPVEEPKQTFTEDDFASEEKAWDS